MCMKIKPDQTYIWVLIQKEDYIAIVLDQFFVLEHDQIREAFNMKLYAYAYYLTVLKDQEQSFSYQKYL